MLEDICSGWSTCGTMTVSGHPAGGIIDHNPLMGWFVIFNDDRVCDEWFPTQELAVAHFVGAAA